MDIVDKEGDSFAIKQLMNLHTFLGKNPVQSDNESDKKIEMIEAPVKNFSLRQIEYTNHGTTRKYPEMKGFYLIMDNSPIHYKKDGDTDKMIEFRDYKCVYLPPILQNLTPLSSSEQ